MPKFGDVFHSKPTLHWSGYGEEDKKWEDRKVKRNLYINKEWNELIGIQKRCGLIGSAIRLVVDHRGDGCVVDRVHVGHSKEN